MMIGKRPGRWMLDAGVETTEEMPAEELGEEAEEEMEERRPKASFNLDTNEAPGFAYLSMCTARTFDRGRRSVAGGDEKSAPPVI